MQHVAHVARHATNAVANARTIQNKQYSNISPGCAAISLVTIIKASETRQRCRYITGSMKLAINDHARRRKIIANINAAIATITYT